MKLRHLLSCAGIVSALVTCGCASHAAKATNVNIPNTKPLHYYPDMKPTRTVAPLYPAIDQASKVQGIVWLCYTVKADGSVDDVHVVDTKLNTTNRDLMAALESAAMNAIRQWRFSPHHVNGNPVKTPDVCQKMEFKLS